MSVPSAGAGRVADRGASLCPSAQPDMAGCVAFGVVGGTAEEPRVSYLRQPLPVVPELLALAEPVEATEVFRFAAPCAEDACQHYANEQCTLGAKIAQLVDGVSFGLPACRIRPRCRWWREQGGDACRRCPMIVTRAYAPRATLRDAATPIPHRTSEHCTTSHVAGASVFHPSGDPG